MNSHPVKLFSAAVIACLFSGGAAAADQKNPLVRPDKVLSAKPGAVGVQPVSSLGLPPPPAAPGLNAPLTAVTSSPVDRVADHLSHLRVVATMGDRAVLRGALGKTGNLALNSAEGGAAPAFGSPVASNDPSKPADAGKPSPDRSVTVISGEVFQLADGVWIRPYVVGSSVKLYFQTGAKEKATDALVYSSSVEIASAIASQMPDKVEDDKKKGGELDKAAK